MTLMQLPDFLQREDGGYIRLTGHRIGLVSIVPLYNEGFSPEMLAGYFPTLPLALIHKVIAFYLENRDEVDAYVAQERAELDRQEREGRKSQATPGLVELRQRMQALRRTGG